MLGLQIHHEGSTAALNFHGSRCYAYSLPSARMPRLFVEGFQSKYTGGLSRDRPSARQPANNDALPSRIRAKARSDTMPYITAAALPYDIPRLVDIEFAAFREEIVNHQLSYRDSKKPEHISRTIKFYEHCMNHLRAFNLERLRSTQKRGRSDSIGSTFLPKLPSLGYRFRKVTDPKTGHIIAFCKTEMTRLTLQDLASPADAGHEGEFEMNRAWFALNEKLHRQYNGLRRHCCE